MASLKNREVGSISVIQKDLKNGFLFTKSLFSMAYIVDQENKRNLISANVIFQVFNLIDTEFTKALFFPFVYSSYAFEKELYRQNAFSLSIVLGEETNFYLFYHETTFTTESYFGVNFEIERFNFALNIEKPWHNSHIEDLDPYVSLDIAIRFN